MNAIIGSIILAVVLVDVLISAFSNRRKGN